MLTSTPSIDRMPGLLAIYADRLAPQDKTPLTFLKARFGIVDDVLAKGGRPGDLGLYQKQITDKHGKKVTQWVRLPKGKTAAHNATQAELFKIHGTPYKSLETRPDTTDKQLCIGVDALTALKRRVNLLRDRGGSAATLLGARLYASFVVSGQAQLTGQKITSPEDLAALAQVYRDPRFETFRCIFLKGDQVVGESAYSSRLPGVVRLPDDYLGQVRSDLGRFGADGYYLLHNHPSGRSMASAADVKMTIGTHFTIPGMLGHVIVDHSEYCTINPNGQKVEVHQKPDLSGPDYHASPSLGHPMLGVAIGGPADIAKAAKALQSELMGGGAVLVMTKGFESRVDLLASVPGALIDTISNKMPRAKAWLRSVGRATGAGSHTFLVVSDADYNSRKPELRRLVSEGLLVDVVSHGGQSVALHDSVSRQGPGLFADKRPGFKVGESLSDDLAAQEKYLTAAAKQLGYADIDDLAMNDYPAFERLAVQWRIDHPVETALYQPVGEYHHSSETGAPEMQTDTPAFKTWFGDSVVTDTGKPGGAPLVVYHGTRSDIQAVNVGRSERLSGFWVTTDPKLANTYAAEGVVNASRYREGANVLPLYVRMEKPYRYDPKKKPMYMAWQEYQEGDYDGFIETGADAKGFTTLNVKSGNQVKSAIGNIGDFDRASPDLSKAQPRIIFFQKAKV